MGEPGGGRTYITPRMLRHYNIIAYTELDEDTIRGIFLRIVTFFLVKFPEEIKSLIPELINSVLIIFNKVKAELLPTPTKSHYTFNLRDISKVF